MKIKFVKHWQVKQGDGRGPVYKTGDVVEFNGPVAETYARKYLARGLAVVDKPEPKKIEVPNDPPPPVEPAIELAPKVEPRGYRRRV